MESLPHLTPPHLTPPRLRVLDTLQPAFRARCLAVIAGCADRGFRMVPYCGVRTPQEQAKLWRQSRPIEQIQREIATLRADGAPWLADLIENAGRQSGPHVTNAMPGLSWHQYGLALDAYPTDERGFAAWGDRDAWAVWLSEIARAGLVHLSFERPHVQQPHVQRPPGSWAQIDAVMRGHFENGWSITGAGVVGQAAEGCVSTSSAGRGPAAA